MGLDAGIYDKINYKLPEQLGAALDPANIQERRMKLADLATARQANDLTLKTAKSDSEMAVRAEALRKAVGAGANDESIAAAAREMEDGGIAYENVKNFYETSMGIPQPQRLAQMTQGLKTSAQLTERINPKWQEGTRFNDTTGLEERVLWDANDPTQIIPFGGQKAQSESGSGGGSPYSSPVYDEQGRLLSYDHRNNGRLTIPKSPFTPDTPGGVAPPVVGAKFSQNLQRGLNAAEAQGTIQGGIAAQPEVDQASAIKLLKTAGYDPKTGKDRVSELIKKSSSGSVQKLGTSVARAFNITTEGGKAITTLTAVANKMTMDLLGGKLGAQISNTDREFIVAQLGAVQDANFTDEERLVAWEDVKTRMIATGILPKTEGGDTPPPSGDIKFLGFE